MRERPVMIPTREFEIDDLHRLYVVVPLEDNSDTELTTASKMTDNQFRAWIIAKANQHNKQILPTFGRLGLETRLAMVNRLIRQGVYFWVAPDDAQAEA